MGKHVRDLDQGHRPKTPAAGAPLDFIYANHLQEREICAMIDTLVQNDTVSASTIAVVYDFLTIDLPLLLLDEEEDLFPLLKRRCRPEDQISKVIARLHRDHAHANEDTPQIVALLQTLASAPRALSRAEIDMLAAYAGHVRRHLILENAIILPFARLRLTEGDLETLHIRMCQRRGLSNLRTTKT